MNKTYLAILGIVVLAIGGWFLLGKLLPKSSNSYPQEAVPSSPSSLQPDSVSLVPVNNLVQQLGRASIQSIGLDGKQVEVTLKFEDLAQEIAHPAHIHLGSCAELGKVAYPLNAVENGFSQTTLNVSVDQLKNQLPLAIKTHKSEQELNIYIACADIDESSF